MPLPLILQKRGYLSSDQLLASRGLLIGTEGRSDSGKSEFLLSCPSPMLVIGIDRMIDGTLRNSNPPITRRPLSDVYFNIIRIPLPSTGKKFLDIETDKTKQDIYKMYWDKFVEAVYEALGEKYWKTVVIDGDSDSWRLQRLAAFGKLSQIMPRHYEEVNNARKALVAKCWDSGKIIIATNKVKDEYEDERDDKGKLVMDDNTGKPKQVKSGNDKNEGFHDIEYLWHIRLKHMYESKKIQEIVISAGPRAGQKIYKEIEDAKWGCEIIKCKPRKMIEGIKLYGEDCSFTGVVKVAFPTIPTTYWG